MPLSPTPQSKKRGLLRFLYLNIYAFLIVFAGILILAVPFYHLTPWILVIQIIIAVKLFLIAGKMFFAWEDKKIKIDVLTKKNHNEFRPDTFEVFMQAPCGRLITRQVLRDLHKQLEYKSLLKLKKPLPERLRNNCAPVKTVVYINEESL